MIIDLLPVLGEDGRTIDISGEVDLSKNREYDVRFLSPAKVEGKILNIGGQLEFSGNISLKLKLMCDRCGEWYEDDLSVDFFEVLKKEADKAEGDDKNADTIFYRGDKLDIFDIIYNNIYMNLPTKKLCKADCKGLCEICGKNLNYESCTCEKDVTDPRFDILDDFFKK